MGIEQARDAAESASRLEVPLSQGELRRARYGTLLFVFAAPLHWLVKDALTIAAGPPHLSYYLGAPGLNFLFWTSAGIGIAGVGLVLSNSRGLSALEMVVRALSRGSSTADAAIKLAEALRDAARQRVEHVQTEFALQERSVALHVQRLTAQISGLRTRALWAFVPGVVLCVGSIAGPLVAWNLAMHHPDNWQYMLGGSALALVLLGSGTTLLRHDSKLQIYVQDATRELQYFERVQTGLDCALAIDQERYKKGLEVVVNHLLAAPPQLAHAHAKAERESTSAMSEKDKAADDTTVDKSDASSSSALTALFLDLIRKASDKS